MNKEIKEILIDLDACRGIFDYTITPDGCEFLYNYITNLQHEIERLKEELQQEKKDFKEANDYCFELKDYKSRCEKASDKLSFIDEALENDTLNVPLCIVKINSALNILQNGSEKE